MFALNQELGVNINAGLPNITGILSGAGNLGIFDILANNASGNAFRAYNYNCDTFGTIWVHPNENKTVLASTSRPVKLMQLKDPDSTTSTQSVHTRSDGVSVEINLSNDDEAGNTSFNDCKMDASKSNPIYGASNTVQPPAYTVTFFRRIS